MKCQDLFFLENNKKKIIIKCRLLQILLGALRVKSISDRYRPDSFRSGQYM